MKKRLFSRISAFCLSFCLILTVCAFASSPITLTLKNGEVVSGYLICETKGNMTLKSGRQTVSIFKKSVKLVGDENVAGAREFSFPDSVFLRDKNEISFVITASDPARVRLRQILPDESETLWGEKSGNPGDTLTFFVPDARFYEAVQFSRDDVFYYLIGQPFDKRTRCNAFSKTVIELRGFPAGQRVPQSRESEKRFKQDDIDDIDDMPQKIQIGD